MIKITIFIIFTAISMGQTISLGFNQEDEFCTNREYGKCNFFVIKKGDLSKQYSCIVVANSVLKGNSYRRASWYYLLGGDVDKAFEVAIIGLDKGDYFLAETLAEIYVIRGDIESAKKYFEIFKKNAKVDMRWIGDHFDTLGRLYTDKFSPNIAKELLGNRSFLIDS